MTGINAAGAALVALRAASLQGGRALHIPNGLHPRRNLPLLSTGYLEFGNGGAVREAQHGVAAGGATNNNL